MAAATTLRSVIGNLAGTVGRSFLEAVFPAKCLVCAEFIDTERSSAVGGDAADNLISLVCSDCLTDIRPVTSPLCDCCGHVFRSRTGEDHICGECISMPKPYRRARAALMYTDGCARLVHQFKYKGKIQLARPLGRILRACLERHWQPHEIDMIVPVPLHRRRLKGRGFNQVWLLLQQWAPSQREPSDAWRSLEVAWELIARTLPTPPQTGLGRRERLSNLRGAFELKRPLSLVDKNLLLVDDVYTTGATVGECARLLRDHGARQVDVLTLARAD